MIDCCRHVSAEKPAISRTRLSAAVRPAAAEQRGAAHARIHGDPEGGHVLRYDRGGSRALHAEAQARHKPQVERDVQHGGNGKEHERGRRVPDGPQHRGKEVVEEHGDHAGKDDEEIGAREAHQLGRRAQRCNDGVRAEKDGRVERQRDDAEQREGGEDALPQRGQILLPEPDGEHRAAAHGQPQQDGVQERHERERGAYRRQRVRPQEPADDERVGNVVALLQQVAQNHRHGEAQHRFRHGAARERAARRLLHCETASFRFEI